MQNHQIHGVKRARIQQRTDSDRTALATTMIYWALCDANNASARCGCDAVAAAAAAASSAASAAVMNHYKQFVQMPLRICAIETLNVKVCVLWPQTCCGSCWAVWFGSVRLQCVPKRTQQTERKLQFVVPSHKVQREVLLLLRCILVHYFRYYVICVACSLWHCSVGVAIGQAVLCLRQLYRQFVRVQIGCRLCFFVRMPILVTEGAAAPAVTSVGFFISTRPEACFWWACSRVQLNSVFGVRVQQEQEQQQQHNTNETT